MKILSKLFLIVPIINFIAFINLCLYSAVKNGNLRMITASINEMVPIKYLVLSGPISLVLIIVAPVMFFAKKIQTKTVVASIVLNLLYIPAYIYWVVSQ